MDQLLVEYLKSGKAWLLIGSGPSISMGYPTWAQLAEFAIQRTAIETGMPISSKIGSAIKRKDYPSVFGGIKELIGGPSLLQILRTALRSNHHNAKIYELIARWPVHVYMTTNYDNAITSHLTQLGEAYISYSNSEDHLALLTPDLNGAIIKLHGDLTSEQGLILTDSDYQAIQEDRTWDYWRIKLTSVFQMIPVIIIGHSLTDKNIRHVLEAAKKGAGVIQPLCWVAPDVTFEQRKEYLEKYRIRVLSYPNQSGDHSNLLRLIEHISDFIPPRLAIHIQQQIADISVSPLGESAAAPGFFVYNKLSTLDGFEGKRVDILLSVIESAIPRLKELDSFTLQEALEKTSWPTYVKIDKDLSATITERAVQLGVIERVDDINLRLGHSAEKNVKKSQQAFEHLKERFKQSLRLRINRKYPTIFDYDASQISSDIEASLIGYFREGGLSLATSFYSDLSSKDRRFAVPSSIVKFITEASTRYDDAIKRQAFCTISVDAFVQSESAERDYLGRIAQGFFAFHALGVFGDVASERLSHAKDTVWLIDSNVQIGLLALSSSSNALFRDCFNKLQELGIRAFATEKLFDEVWQHFYFADKIVEREGPNSQNILAAALGDPPYYRSNAFLEGFINWQTAGNPCDWKLFLFEIFGQRTPAIEDVKNTLKTLGLQILSIQDWPGFNQTDFADCDQYSERIVDKMKISIYERDIDTSRDPYRKARPEAEALVIIKGERDGKYYIMSEPGRKSPSWFISDTSILNIVDQITITWQPEEFVKFMFTLPSIVDTKSADRAFEAILLSIAQSGLSLISDKVVSSVFGGVIDQTRINLIEQRQEYHDTIGSKYGESPEQVLERLAPRYRLIAGVQFAEERAQVEAIRRIKAEKKSEEVIQELKALKKTVEKFDNLKKKLEDRKAKSKRKSRKNKSGGKKKGRK